MMFSGPKMSNLTWSWHSTCEIMEAQFIGDIEKADNEVKLRVGQVYKPSRAFQPCAIFCKDQLIP